MRNFNYDVISDPVKEYESRYKNEFSKKAAAKFEDLVKKSCVDEKANEKLVNEIKRLQEDHESHSNRKGLWVILMVSLIVVLVMGVTKSLSFSAEADSIIVNVLLIIVWLPLGYFWIKGAIYTGRKIKYCNQECLRIQSLCDDKKKEAWNMMSPLNRLFQWEMVNDLITQTMPIFEIDRFFNKARLNQLFRDYGLKDFGANRSVSCCQSGSLNGNPWIMADVITQYWVDVTYRGHKDITYHTLETRTDSNGHTRCVWVRKKERLYATHTEKAPRYKHDKFLVYGFKDDVQNLSFSRQPTNVAGYTRREDNKIKEIRKLGRDLEKGIVITSHERFDASFYAIDRNDEKDFRKLFDSSTQDAVYKLLKDKTIGYGDDFSFRKNGKLNLLSSAHLDKTDISGDPKEFHNYDLGEARQRFKDSCAEYFRSFYFSFAPLLCAELYQTHNWLDDSFPSETGKAYASVFECESLANYMGENMFVPENAETDNILKARIESESENTASVVITANSFKKVKRCVNVSTFGGDFCFHDVPVEYDVFVPVSKETRILVTNPETADSIAFDDLTKTKEWAERIDKIGAESEIKAYRRGLAASRSN